MTHRTAKAEQTRQRVLSAALTLIREQGYEKTTMRAIARRAGLSLGAAYYYFPGKEHIIQAFYEQSYLLFVERAREVLRHQKQLETRLGGVLRAQFDTAAPFHSVSKVLFKAAADPASSLSPFSEASKPLRDLSIRLYAETLAGAGRSFPQPWPAKLPVLLWLLHMGVIAFWIFDTSPRQKKTYKLIQKAAPFLARLLRWGAKPAFRPMLRAALELVSAFDLLNQPWAEDPEPRTGGLS